MGKLVFGILVAAIVAATAERVRAESPVVVELFTSQGCSSCPPADELLGEIAALDEVIALSFHVDYWDYIGWKDSFADPAFTKRQKSYAHAAGQNMIYTPQIIVGGKHRVPGTKAMKVLDLIHKQSDRPDRFALAARRDGFSIGITMRPSGASGDYEVQLVTYDPVETVEIAHGENAGRTLTYHNVVTSVRRLEPWDGTSVYETRAEGMDEAPAVVLVQESGPGAIVAAVHVE